MPPTNDVRPGPNTISVLLTTDNHVGYNESDPIRGDDSWQTFHEITRIARDRDVDMVIQGGDLFHVSKPSKKSLYHVIKLLRENCLGDRPCELELLTDPQTALRGLDHANFEDPNLNVGVPVFAISGNHDDATGDGLLLPMDVMAATGLVNFFGLLPEQDKITITPLVFQKGTTKLSLYGINNLRDERLQRIMRNGDVIFQRPAGDIDLFFNLLCLHQNHLRHSMTSFIPEDFLPSMLDFVMWGHEHECLPDPQYNPATGFDTLQPGSSVATALSAGETALKHVFLMHICGKKYLIEAIPLQTVRPFVMHDVLLREESLGGVASRQQVADFLVSKVDDLIEEAKESGHGDTSKLPLIRLRVDLGTVDVDLENSRRFSNKFVGKVANVDDILLYHRKQRGTKNEPQFSEPLKQLGDRVSIQKILKEMLGELNLYVVPEDGMYDITKRYIEQEDKHVFSEYVENFIKKTSDSLVNLEIDTEDLQGDDAALRKSFRQLLTQLRLDAIRDRKKGQENNGTDERVLPTRNFDVETGVSFLAESNHMSNNVVHDLEREEELVKTKGKAKATGSRAKVAKSLKPVVESDKKATRKTPVRRTRQPRSKETVLDSEPEDEYRPAANRRPSALRGIEVDSDSESDIAEKASAKPRARSLRKANPTSLLDDIMDLA